MIKIEEHKLAIPLLKLITNLPSPLRGKSLISDKIGIYYWLLYGVIF
jgi:hypothetical protein